MACKKTARRRAKRERRLAPPASARPGSPQLRVPEPCDRLSSQSRAPDSAHVACAGCSFSHMSNAACAATRRVLAPNASAKLAARQPLTNALVCVEASLTSIEHSKPSVCQQRAPATKLMARQDGTAAPAIRGHRHSKRAVMFAIWCVCCNCARARVTG